MQRWWLAAAAVVGIGLAVLLIPRPDTGDDVPDAETPSLTVGPALDPGTLEEGLVKSRVRKGSTEKAETSEERLKDPKINPIAERVEARRDVPESRFAARALAPWTELRRRLAAKDAESDEAVALIERLNDMGQDMRTLRREPYTMDWAEIEEEQKLLIADVRASRLNDPDVEEMLVLIETRMDEYYQDRASQEEAGASEETP